MNGESIQPVSFPDFLAARLPWAKRLIPLVLLAQLLVGCAHYPINAPLAAHDPAHGYRLENLHDADNSSSLLVVLTLSGGGTRAAALAYGVLEQLGKANIEWEGRRKRLLDEVDIISAVSGGSYTAAYYALYRDRLFVDFEHDFLTRNVQGEVTRKILAPLNLIRTSGPMFGRPDLLDEYLDDELFHGATFGHLLQSGRRPFLIINASDMSLGARFEFTQDQFDLLCSDLSAYPLSRAVAASSAVPFVLSPMTLRNYAGTCGYREPDWVPDALADRTASARRFSKASELRSYLDADTRPFIHLLDGGISDNTGARGLLDRVLSQQYPQLLAQELSTPALRKVVLIMVSAETRPDLSLDRIESAPTILQVVRNVKDIPINRYSFETTELLRAHFDAMARRDREQGSAASTIEFYQVEVALETIPDESERLRFMNIPTSFYLPAEQVDELRQLAARLLANSPEYRRLRRDLNASEASDVHTDQARPDAQ
jgi:NTE family protein